MSGSVRAGNSQYEYHIGGVPVKFPVKAYPTQMAMMAKIIQALSYKENALLESPTGSGKSLALLCSALAWQKQEYVKIEQEEMKEALKAQQAKNCLCECHGNVQATPTVQAAGLPGSSVKSSGSTMVNFQVPSTPAVNVTTIPTCTSTANFPIAFTFDQFTSQVISLLPNLIVPLPQPAPSNPSTVVSTPATTVTNSSSSVVSNSAVKIEQLDSNTRLPVAVEKGPNTPDKHLIEQLDGTTRPPSAANKGTNGGTSKGQSSEEATKSKTDVKDDDDTDFKVSNKRFRTPCARENGNKRKRAKKKGVNYEDVPESEGIHEVPLDPPQWKMEFPSGVVPDVGVPQSQIIDSDAPKPKVEPMDTSNLLQSTAKPKAKPLDTSKSIKTEPSFKPTACTQPKTEPMDPSHLILPLTTPTVKPKREPANTPNFIPPIIGACHKCGCCPPSKSAEAMKADNMARRQKGPKIFFGTRTHKQIAQITHELARTAYADTPMCILASREHTCIHPEVSRSKNKNDECKKKLDGKEGELCSYYLNVAKRLGTQAQLRAQGFSSAWDIEDLVTLGKRIRTCPYFATRGLVEEADIIFCPYNYLINPHIRDMMQIDLSNKVIILDEAHNMEDSSREAASISLTSVQMVDISKEIDKVKELLDTPHLLELRQSYLQLQAFCSAVIRWMEETAKTLPTRGYEQAYGIWTGQDFLPVMEKELGINENTLLAYTAHLEAILETNSDREQRDEIPSISSNSLNLFKGVFMVMGYLFKGGGNFTEDYRMSLIKSMVTMANVETGGAWISRRRKSRVQEKVWVFTLNFWCLNPAVAFSMMTQARSIVLTSGTLSPMSSFSSELGVAFPIQLEANHVIPESQTWISSISHGPSGRSLIANYQNTETFDFQDELGEVILRVCQTVPYGVLCFFSSYKMMEKLTNRWQDTGLWYKILREKFIVSEPRSGRKEDFESAMATFYNIVNESTPERTTSQGEECQTGALFLAVCRGKVSEGLDFANNNARAVITVGIPFPSIKDKQVELKREYNNEHYRRRGLLTGSEWYEIQAYRALNQALGRCIRHKKDWGALILVDERYSKGHHYTKGLSKWVRQRIHHKRDFKQALSSLREFTEHRMRVDSDANSSSMSVCASPSLGVSMFSPHHTSMSATPGHPNSTASSSSSLATPNRPQNSNPANTISSVITSTPGFGTSNQPSNSATPLKPHLNTSNLPTPDRPLASPIINTPLSLPSVGSTPAKHPYTSANGVTKSPCRTTSTPLSSRPGGVSKLSDFVLSTQKPTDGQLAQKSRFEYPNSSILLSQLPNMYMAPKSFAGEGGGPFTAVPKTPPRKTALVESQPAVIVLDDSLEESSKMDTTPTILPAKAIKNSTVTLETPIVCADSPTDTMREESPILFDTPSTVGVDQSLAVKLAKRALTSKQPSPSKPVSAERPSSPKLALDDPKPSNLLPTEKNPCSDIEKSVCEQLSPNHNHATRHSPPCDDFPSPTDDIDATPPIPDDQKPKTPLTIRLKSASRDKLSLTGTRVAKIQKKREDGLDSPLGQPRVRRANTRLSKRLCAGEGVAGAFGDIKNDDSLDDFKQIKENHKSRQINEEKGCTVCCSSCSEELTNAPVQAEDVEIKQFFSKSYGSFKLTVITSSRLWQHLAGTKSKRKPCHTISIPAQFSSCQSVQGKGVYNAVWDDDLGLCFTVVKCSCGQVMGVSILASTEASHPLVGQTLFSQDKAHSV